MLIKNKDDFTNLVLEYKALSADLNRPLEVGENWYLVDKNWFDQYERYAKAAESSDENIATKCPGPIDNTGILIENGSEESRLRSDINENVHFVFVPSEHFARLKSRFNLVEPWHEICRTVIETGLQQKKAQIEMNPLRLNIAHPSSADEYKIHISRSASMASLCSAARQSLNIADEAEIRLFLQHKGTAEMELLTFEKDQALEEFNLCSDQKLVIDSKQVDGTWHIASANGGSKDAGSYAESISERLRSSSANLDSVVLSKDSGLCGLTNLGNTCFMNSGLQCMSNTVPLSQYFVSNFYKKEINETNPLGMQGQMAEAFGDLIKQMWSGKNTAVNPRNFKYTVGRFAPQFSGYAQQDSQELLAFLLDGLHEDLNRVRKKPYIESKDYDGQNDAENASEAWLNYKRRNDSVIVDLFHGQLKSTLVCPVCSERSVTFDPFCYLSLPLSIKRDRTLLATFVPLDVQAPIIQCQVNVPERPSINDVTEGLCKVLGLPASIRLIFADVHLSRFQKFYAPSDELNFPPDRSLFAYETVADDSDNVMSIKIYSRIVKKSTFFTSSTSLVGMPLILALDRTEPVTYGGLYEKLITLMNRFVDWNDSELQKTEDDDSGADENGDVAMEDNSAAAQTQAALRGEPFKVFLTNSWGSTDMAQLQADSQLSERPSDDVYLCLEWKADFEKFFSHEVAIEKHESVYANKAAKRSVHLNECLDLFTTNERLGKHDLWFCPKCKAHQQATKKFDLWKVPEILIIHLKRFSYDSYYRRKIEVLVDFPLQNLNVKPWIVDEHAQETGYDLIAVSNHYGGLCGGHYTAYAKNFVTKKWYLFDDSRVSSAEEAEVISKAAYVLVYARRAPESQKIDNPSMVTGTE